MFSDSSNPISGSSAGQQSACASLSTSSGVAVQQPSSRAETGKNHSFAAFQLQSHLQHQRESHSTSRTVATARSKYPNHQDSCCQYSAVWIQTAASWIFPNICLCCLPGMVTMPTSLPDCAAEPRLCSKQDRKPPSIASTPGINAQPHDQDHYQRAAFDTKTESSVPATSTPTAPFLGNHLHYV